VSKVVVAFEWPSAPLDRNDVAPRSDQPGGVVVPQVVEPNASQACVFQRVPPAVSDRVPVWRLSPVRQIANRPRPGEAALRGGPGWSPAHWRGILSALIRAGRRSGHTPPGLLARSLRASNVIRIARSRNSSGYFLGAAIVRHSGFEGLHQTRYETPIFDWSRRHRAHRCPDTDRRFSQHAYLRESEPQQHPAYPSEAGCDCGRVVSAPGLTDKAGVPTAERAAPILANHSYSERA
jgi:hypothetical protein